MIAKRHKKFRWKAMAANNANSAAKNGRRILPKAVSFWSVPISKTVRRSVRFEVRFDALFERRVAGSGRRDCHVFRARKDKDEVGTVSVGT
jgi:hypothetical protein